MTKFINCILFIDTFEQQCVVLKGMLQLTYLKDQMNTIGIDQLGNNRDSFEQKYLNNIKDVSTWW